MINKLRAYTKLLKEREVANQQIEAWIENQFEMLRAGRGGREEKSFDDLFEIVPTTEKIDAEQRFYCLRFINCKFVAAETNELKVTACAYCGNQPCKADKLLLSQKVYETTEKQYELKLYIGCDGYANSPRFIPLQPKPGIGIYYAYCLLYSYLDHLVTTIPGATTARMISIEELKKCKFFIHSVRKRTKFNKDCTPAFKKQQIFEREIFVLKKLIEEEEKAIQMCTFLKQIHWKTCFSY